MSLQVLLADTPELREAKYALRYVIYVEEMGKSPPAADHQRRWIRDGLDATALLYAVQDEAGALVGTLRLNRLSDLRDPITQLTPLPIATLLERFPPAAISHTSRLMLLPAWRGGAALGLLFKRCYGDAAEAGIRVDLCHAKPGLVELYEQLGYRRFCPGLDLEGVGYIRCRCCWPCMTARICVIAVRHCSVSRPVVRLKTVGVMAAGWPRSRKAIAVSITALWSPMSSGLLWAMPYMRASRRSRSSVA